MCEVRTDSSQFEGTDLVTPGNRKYLSFCEARAFVHTLGLKAVAEWRAYCNSKRRPPDIPTNPNRQYAQAGWVSWVDWIGTATIASNKRVYRAFEDARAYVRSLGLKSANEWRDFTRSGSLPEDIPVGASRTYANKGWVSWGDWLGTNTAAPQYNIATTRLKKLKTGQRK